MINYRQKTIGIWFFFFIFIYNNSFVFAESNPAIGKVVAIRGNILATGAGKIERALFLKAPVFLYDVIHTGNGRIQLMFEDNTLITLGRNTQMEISKYAWKSNDTDSAMETKISEGSFRIMGGAITRTAPDNFKTHGPSGTIGIRGSMYAGIIKGQSMSILFQGGKGIYVKNQTGMVNISRPGFGTMVKSPDHPPEPPKQLSGEDIIQLEKMLAQAPENEPAQETDAGESPDSTIVDSSPAEAPPQNSDEQPGPGDSSIETTEQMADAEPDNTPGTGPEPGEASVDNFQVTEPEAGPGSEPAFPGSFSDISAIAGDAVVNSTQNTLVDSLLPTDTEGKIKFLLVELGFSDLTRSTSIQGTGSGVWGYAGKMQNTLVAEPDQSIKMAVNWYNRRIMAFEEFGVGGTQQGIGFGFGTVNTDGSITNVKILGSDTYDRVEPMALTGTQTFGQFYGASNGGLGMALSGDDYEIQTQANAQPWADLVAGVLVSQTTSNTGTQSWEGFFVGVAEDMSQPDVARRIFHNTGSANFYITIDKDNGWVSGTMSGSDYENSSNLMTNITIGGNADSDSVYIDDKTIGATLGGGGTITIDPNAAVGVQTYGNYMVTSRKTALSSYTAWGYWEAVYVDPGSTNTYHIHVPGSLWIAGERTVIGEINTLIANTFTGVYTGGAEGIKIDNTGQMTQLTNGSTNLTIQFGVTNPVSGTISFGSGDTLTLDPAGSTAGTTGFRAEIVGDINAGTNSGVDGLFYGPNAASIGGKFSAEMAGGTQYHGIIGGDR
ncbi:MAG: FecR domain-containing protein [Pseudomonadota bacterium]